MVVGVAAGKDAARVRPESALAGVRQRQPDQCSDRRPDLADDHPDDDEGRLSRDPRRRAKARGLLVTLFVNWLVKPFSMALDRLALLPPRLRAWISPAEADQYIAGCIILAAAPCTAMVFVWSYLTDGDPAYTLVQVSVNDLIMLVLFAPIVRFLVSGASSLNVPFSVLLYFGDRLHRHSADRRGRCSAVAHRSARRANGSNERFLPKFAPVTIGALLATLVLIFAFQADNITGRSSTCS